MAAMIVVLALTFVPSMVVACWPVRSPQWQKVVLGLHLFASVVFLAVLWASLFWWVALFAPGAVVAIVRLSVIWRRQPRGVRA
ncbi:hypothetical protein [Amycolatopsis sp. FDAARGOS 1241]|uniref:hypothetical protein n=1 Tax=Amycolatopsis sp. FDAARGOS 1241 TaxID=2778070 RepID=UPI00194FFE9D|nr:hypothetical protein [Amycolatopsis sp. FDAARGOS 1241]QRP46523.1 hypothetical protein I6J71_00020 [Amycolatopsis sp. FDAARGOS 1241]